MRLQVDLIKNGDKSQAIKSQAAKPAVEGLFSHE
jgi:hypothetical protein